MMAEPRLTTLTEKSFSRQLAGDFKNNSIPEWCRTSPSPSSRCSAVFDNREESLCMNKAIKLISLKIREEKRWPLLAPRHIDENSWIPLPIPRTWSRFHCSLYRPRVPTPRGERDFLETYLLALCRGVEREKLFEAASRRDAFLIVSF